MGVQDLVLVVLDDLGQLHAQPGVPAEMRQNHQEAAQQGGPGVDGAEVAVKIIPPTREPSVGGPFPPAPGSRFRAETAMPDSPGGLGPGQFCGNHRSVGGRESACGGQHLRTGVVQLAVTE